MTDKIFRVIVPLRDPCPQVGGARTAPDDRQHLSNNVSDRLEERSSELFLAVLSSTWHNIYTFERLVPGA